MVKAFSFMLDHGTSEETIRRRAEMALAVDESLGRLMAALEKNNELDNTVIMFTSDNGFFFGEQELYDLQEDPYEMHNLIDDPKAQDLVDELQVELARLVVQAMGLSESR